MHGLLPISSSIQSDQVIQNGTRDVSRCDDAEGLHVVIDKSLVLNSVFSQKDMKSEDIQNNEESNHKVNWVLACFCYDTINPT